eukprot:TRINITY_DN2683_c0_g1_i4.p2 TRINITY_DN2683_c0_g1~~TRINITY_DN2683_c0_g1_i4.p2  ORF type:complete len:216 (-),score=19.73 TRINITY_DN2683_c0_g1_i4:1776-2423(-)
MNYTGGDTGEEKSWAQIDLVASPRGQSRKGSPINHQVNLSGAPDPGHQWQRRAVVEAAAKRLRGLHRHVPSEFWSLGVHWGNIRNVQQQQALAQHLPDGAWTVWNVVHALKQERIHSKLKETICDTLLYACKAGGWLDPDIGVATPLEDAQARAFLCGMAAVFRVVVGYEAQEAGVGSSGAEPLGGLERRPAEFVDAEVSYSVRTSICSLFVLQW